MSHFITTHNTANESVFSSSCTEQRPAHDVHGTSVEPVYTFETFPPDLSSEDDIEQYEHDRESIQGLTDKQVAAVVASFPPGTETAMHRTSTVNIGVVVEGVIELHLDSGEMRTLEKGDSYTQRGTMHKWKNPGQEWARVATFTIPIIKPLEPNGSKPSQDAS